VVVRVLNVIAKPLQLLASEDIRKLAPCMLIHVAQMMLTLTVNVDTGQNHARKASDLNSRVLLFRKIASWRKRHAPIARLSNLSKAKTLAPASPVASSGTSSALAIPDERVTSLPGDAVDLPITSHTMLSVTVRLVTI